MRKRMSLFIIFFALFFVGIWIAKEQDKIAWFEIKDEEIYVHLKADGRDVMIEPWYDEEENIYYFFLPAFVKSQKIYFDKVTGGNIKIADSLMEHHGSDISWEQNRVYKIESKDTLYNVSFMKSENLSAFFVSTDSGSLEYIHKDKENQEKGEVSVVDANGHLQYSGQLDKISIRGNSTALPYKKPYTITLQEPKALCGLESGKKWNLLALYFEHDKMHSKIIFDMAREMGLAYTSECTWVDLYCNGEYKGLYLLTEAITVAEGRVGIHDLDKDNEELNLGVNLDELELVQNDRCRGYPISSDNMTGGYLIEKDIDQRISDDQVCFSTTGVNYIFTVKNPKYASLEQVDYIAEFVQKIENLLLQNNPRYKSYIDIASFARQFLIDKIALDTDGMRMSTFYYKEKNVDVLYAGPVWDYDRAMGEIIPNYEEPIEGNPNWMWEWYMPLYNDEEFYSEMLAAYQDILPYMKKVLYEDIDYYAETIQASVAMDSILMERYGYANETTSYTDWENYVRYLKFFLANRLNYLTSLWEISYERFLLPESTGEYHEVVFRDENGRLIERRMVLDGECISNLPELDVEKYVGWFMNKENKEYSNKIPIYEDIIMEAICY